MSSQGFRTILARQISKQQECTVDRNHKKDWKKKKVRDSFEMATFRFVLISILMLSTGWAAQNFLPVSVCPRDKDSWKLESDRKNCRGDTPDYLCAAIENQVGNFGEICTKFGLTPSNKCAVLNEQTHNLDSVDCKAPSGCPSKPYIPAELWQYQICYEDFYGTTISLAPTTTQDITSATTNSGNKTLWDGLEDGGSGTGVGVVVAVVIILIIVAVAVGIMVVFYQRNQFGFRDKVQRLQKNLREYFEHGVENTADAEVGEAQGTHDPLLGQDVKENETNSDTNVEPPEKKKEELKELLKYLVHILKQELGVNDLKEKVVIHSKSVNEHFSEPVIKDLQSLNDINDYSRLDTSLVFTLLRNFCEGIKPPSRGWDYEPPDNETHVGADIERIRSMWNKYCDDDVQFKYLDDVYNRMKEKYGTVAVHGDDGVKKSPSKDEVNAERFDLLKDKIQSVKLNPDCLVEKGIVITENITTALKILNSRNVVILKGVIGCGKTHALMAIENHLKENGWEPAWVESENLKEEISHEKPTIHFLDNLFGRFGCSVFSQDAVNQTEEVLKEIHSSKSKTKVVIGIHTHVYDEVKKFFKLNFLQQKNITVEMDNLSEAETLLIYKEQVKSGHCTREPSCWFNAIGFQSVLDKLSKNQGHIGGPFLSLMYCNQHELFSDDAFSVNPVKTLMQHFERIRKDSPERYDCLVYLMCVQQHNLEEEPKKWAGLMSVEMTKNNLNELAKTSGFVKVNDNTASLVHELLTTVLIKSASESRVLVLPVLQMCKSDVVIQLLRPPGSTHNDLYLEYLNETNEHSKNIGKMCAYRLAKIYEKQGITHPLVTVELVHEKYVEYLKREPKELSLIRI
nr:uncharacterized protein LOC117693156 isoform X4 [Crassostrea gigas]